MGWCNGCRGTGVANDGDPCVVCNGGWWLNRARKLEEERDRLREENADLRRSCAGYNAELHVAALAENARLRQAIGDQIRWLASVLATGRYTGVESALNALEAALKEE